jgi:hypothetical protein
LHTNQVYMKDLTVVKPSWLEELAPHFYAKTIDRDYSLWSRRFLWMLLRISTLIVLSILYAVWTWRDWCRLFIWIYYTISFIWHLRARANLRVVVSWFDSALWTVFIIWHYLINDRVIIISLEECRKNWS